MRKQLVTLLYIGFHSCYADSLQLSSEFVQILQQQPHHYYYYADKPEATVSSSEKQNILHYIQRIVNAIALGYIAVGLYERYYGVQPQTGLTKYVAQATHFLLPSKINSALFHTDFAISSLIMVIKVMLSTMFIKLLLACIQKIYQFQV